MSRLFITTIYSSLFVLLTGCTSGQFEPITIPNPTPQESTAIDVNSEPALIPPEATTTVSPALKITSTPIDNLDEAVKNMVKADSFEMIAHEVISYQSIGADGRSNQVYGEFTSDYSVIRRPLLKVYGHHEYRFAPMTEYSSYDSYAYQQNDQYFSKLVETYGISTPEEVELPSIEPFSGDVYQTLITYSDQARLVTETDNLAVYFLAHPKWYLLEGAIGFADLGFLLGQVNGEHLIEQYVADHYPNVEPVEFTIFVDVNERLITKVEINNRTFMHSVWAAVDRALLEQGAEVKSLTQYEIMDDHKSEYLIINYNQVQDFDLAP